MRTIEDAMSSGQAGEINIVCPNPDHNDRHPSAWVNTVSGLWICFSCGAGGKVDAENYEISTSEVNRELAKLVFELEHEDRTISESWLSQFDAAGPGEYWLSRFSADTCRQFRLGYDYSDGTATFPVRRLNGSILGVGRRTVTGQGTRYDYPHGVKMSEFLFAYDMCDDDIIILTEGATDAIAAWEVGFQAMAIYGSRISKAQQDALTRYNPKALILAFDMDDAGNRVSREAEALFPHLVTERPTWDRYKDLASMPLTLRKVVLAISRRNVRNRLAQTVHQEVA